jgi:hypothetical protein
LLPILAYDNAAGMMGNGGPIRRASRTQALMVPVFMLVVREGSRDENRTDGNRYRRYDG